jgi:hypothetical protein
MTKNEDLLDELRRKMKWEGGLSRLELIKLASFLDSKDEEEQATAINLIGYTGEMQYFEKIFYILQTTNFPMVAWEALWAISRYYDSPLYLRSFLLKILRNFAAEFEDVTGELMRRSLIAAGDIIAIVPNDAELLCEIFTVFETVKDDPILKDEAYRALCRSEEIDFNGLEFASKILTDFDYDLLKRIKSKMVRQ